MGRGALVALSPSASYILLPLAHCLRSLTTPNQPGHGHVDPLLYKMPWEEPLAGYFGCRQALVRNQGVNHLFVDVEIGRHLLGGHEVFHRIGPVASFKNI